MRLTGVSRASATRTMASVERNPSAAWISCSSGIICSRVSCSRRPAMMDLGGGHDGHAPFATASSGGQQLGDRGGEVGELDRLLEELGGRPFAVHHRLEDVCLGVEFLGEAAHDDDRDALGLGLVAQLEGHVEAVGVVIHHDVEHHEVGPLHGEPLARLDAAVGGVHLVPAGLQERLDAGDQVAVVVHHQDALGLHDSPPLFRCALGVRRPRAV